VKKKPSTDSNDDHTHAHGRVISPYPAAAASAGASAGGVPDTRPRKDSSDRSGGAAASTSAKPASSKARPPPQPSADDLFATIGIEAKPKFVDPKDKGAGAGAGAAGGAKRLGAVPMESGGGAAKWADDDLDLDDV